MTLNESTLFNLARNSQVTIIVRPNNCTIMSICSYDCIFAMHNLFQSLDPVPPFYGMSFESLDGHGSDLVINVTVHRNNEIISIVMEDVLPSKSLWNASILAYGCETDRTHTIITELSKLMRRK